MKVIGLQKLESSYISAQAILNSVAGVCDVAVGADDGFATTAEGAMYYEIP